MRFSEAVEALAEALAEPAPELPELNVRLLLTLSDAQRWAGADGPRGPGRVTVWTGCLSAFGTPRPGVRTLAGLPLDGFHRPPGCRLRREP